jgi:multidrug efflux system membrane fusion protein
LRIAFLPFLLLSLLTACGDRNDTPSRPAAEAAGAAKPADNDDDGPGVNLKPDAQARAGLKVMPLAGHALQAELIAYGRVEEDPSVSFTVRAPYSGTLRLAAGQTWPAVGRRVAAHTAFGTIEPRLQLTDRLSLNTQLAAARADLNAGLAAVTAAQIAYDRTRTLNADNKNVSDRALQEAAAKLAAEKTHEAGARALIQVLESSLTSAAASDIRPLLADRAGEVMEVLAQPGESIEQGAPLVRLTQPDHLLVRIDLPLGEHLPSNGGSARIVPAGFEDQAPLAAQQVAIAAASDPHALGTSFLYRLSQTRPGLRPGNAVTAHFTLPGRAGDGVLIPRSAIVQQDGRPWVYVQTKDDRFSRKPVPLDMPVPAGYLAARGFTPGDRLVVTGAQTLLSEEFKSKNEADTN